MDALATKGGGDNDKDEKTDCKILYERLTDEQKAQVDDIMKSKKEIMKHLAMPLARFKPPSKPLPPNRRLYVIFGIIVEIIFVYINLLLDNDWQTLQYSIQATLSFIGLFQ